MNYLLSLFAGLAAGSFSNVCILRLPNDESLWVPRSHCTGCGKTIKAIHNIPLISFLFLKGRCFYCQKPISWQYPMIEAGFAILYLFHARRFSGDLSRLIVADILGFYLVTLSIIDYRHRIIPDELSISLLGLGLLGSFWNPYLIGSPGVRFLYSLTAGIGGGLFMLLLAWAGEKAFKKEAMGGGDIKLIAACASVLGWPGLFGPLLIGSLSGGVVALILLILKKKRLGETLPFGPFLSLGAYITCLFPSLCMYLISPK